MYTLLRNFYSLNLNYCIDTNNIIDLIELKQTDFLIDQGFIFDYIIIKNLDNRLTSVMFNPNNIGKYLDNKECFGIKWKYLGNYIEYEKLNNKYLNFLMRYIKIIKNEMIPDIPNYFPNYSKELFNYKYYKETYRFIII